MQFPKVMQLLCRWITEQTPADAEHPFCFTSVVLNKDLFAPIHRDSQNEGPNLVKSFVPCQCGWLRYWPGDDGSVSLRKLEGERHVDLNVGAGPVLMDGKRGHAVLPIFGERLSMVAYTRAGSHQGVPNKLLHELRKLGCNLPTNEIRRYHKALFFNQPHKQWPKK